MTDQLTMTQPTEILAADADLVLPVLIAVSGDRAANRYVEFFTARIRNRNTRRAYGHAAAEFGMVRAKARVIRSSHPADPCLDLDRGTDQRNYATATARVTAPGATCKSYPHCRTRQRASARPSLVWNAGTILQSETAKQSLTHDPLRRHLARTSVCRVCYRVEATTKPARGKCTQTSPTAGS